MSIRILKNGVLDTVQDAGREGYAHLGINPGGAMDVAAMKVANILVGNDPLSAVMEMHFPAAEILFEETAMLALAGADVAAYAGGEEVPVLHPFVIRKNTTLSFKKINRGARIYLAVKGGFALSKWLNSYSTNTKAKAGGYHGRQLRKNDRLFFKQQYKHEFSNAQCVSVLPWSANLAGLYTGNTIRFVPGEAFALLREASKTALATKPCTISRESDRMGFRLQAENLQLTEQKEMISAAVTRGTIQLLPSGQMIILMADHQTTGGYPVIGYVISADFPSLAQLQPGESFLLQQTDLQTAEAAMLKQQMNLQVLRDACELRASGSQEWNV